MVRKREVQEQERILGIKKCEYWRISVKVLEDINNAGGKKISVYREKRCKMQMKSEETEKVKPRNIILCN